VEKDTAFLPTAIHVFGLARLLREILLKPETLPWRTLLLPAYISARTRKTDVKRRLE
jgi:hypothetical protein